jgi:hypothetical protein
LSAPIDSAVKAGRHPLNTKSAGPAE